MIQDVDPVNFLCEMATVKGFGSHAMWEQIILSLRTLRNCQRIGVVANRDFLTCRVQNVEPWLTTELKYFTPDQIDEAWHWVRERES